MMNWLFGGVAGFIFLIIAILIIVAVYAPSARSLMIKLIISFVVVLFVGGSVYCGIQVDRYLNAEGGIYGYITGLLETNTATQEEDSLVFKLNNIVLTQDEGDQYSALIYPNNVIDLEEDKQYTIYVNNIPLIPEDSSNSYIVADYTYKFFNDDMTVALEDKLRFNLSFDDYVTTFKITTNGGQSAVNYWNNYFSKNKLTIEIKELSFELEDKSEIVDIPKKDNVTLTYYVDEEVFSSVVYPKDTNITVFLEPIKEGYFFLGWSVDKTNLITELTLNKDYSLYAVFTSEIVLFDADGMSDDFVYIEGSNLETTKSFDLNDAFDFDLTGKKVEITFQYFLETDAGPACTWNDYIILNSGETWECTRNGNELWATISLNNSILTIKNEGFVSIINDITFEITKLVLHA